MKRFVDRADMATSYALHLAAAGMVMSSRGHAIDVLPDWSEMWWAAALVWAGVWGLVGLWRRDVRVEMVGLPASITTLSVFMFSLVVIGDRHPSAALIGVAWIHMTWRLIVARRSIRSIRSAQEAR